MPFDHIDASIAAFRAGREAFAAGQTVHVNPYRVGTWLRADWLDGWRSAQREAEIDQKIEQGIREKSS